MAKEDNHRQEIVPYFKISFSRIEGPKIESNMTKANVYFELRKYLIAMEMTSPPGDGLIPPPVPPEDGGGIIAGR